MESTREERLQMRQRGAGTRQIKAVDFGFSFGAPASDSAASVPNPLFPEPNESSQAQPAPAPAPKATTPPPLKVSSQPASQTIGQPQRTPGSARNRLPQRLSTYDIPIDDRPEGQRSNKRRRITSPEPTEIETPSKTSVRVNTPKPSPNGGSVVTEAAVSHNADVSMPDAPQQETPIAAALPEDPTINKALPDNGAGITIPDPTVQAVSEEQTQSIYPSPDLVSTTDTSKEKRPQKSRSPPPNDSGREIHTTVDPIDPSGKKQRKRRSPPQVEKSPAEERAEQQTVEPQKPTSVPLQGVRQLKTRIPRAKPTSTDTPHTDQPEKTAVAQSGPSNQESENVAVNVTENADNNSIEAQKSSETTTKTRGRKGRPGNSDRAPAHPLEETVPGTESETQPQLDISQTKASLNDKRPRNKPWLSTKDLEEKSQTESGTESEPSKSRRGRPSLSAKKNDMKTQAEPETEVEPEAGPPTSRRGRSATNKSAADSEPTDLEVETMSEPQVEPEQELVESEQPRSRRGRPGKKAKLTTEPETTSEQQLDIESEPRVDSEHEDEPKQSKSRRGRPGKKTKLAAEADSIVPGEQVGTETEPRPEPVQEVESATSNTRRKRPKKGRMEADSESTHREEAGTETVQERRKPKEPRGETVPVTVHRLFNPSALGAMYASSGSGDEDEDSADELSARQKTKLPNRGGVNHADVLSQICRETLEKTLAALNNGIENETNTQRRAEWTRKRKSVQVFGSELDARLLDLSEMLDSNFVLGVQLKKTKREMMDMRTHLYKVRRERESIALQMDAVRAKHMEEEKAKTSRTTINNSLHSLDLALDRQHRAPPATDPSPADLEFMLRTVAEDVSCRAPGAQGGLLDQIRAFNAQLEATARRLER
ncbi:hypothetical protein N7454_009620 [Penicillium verhagenii]|nr:hypothetical protein N7454_009620 [Penicillium verhagenii]